MPSPSQTPASPQIVFTYVPVTHEGRQAYEVIADNGRGTGIIRATAQSANGIAQTMNHNARKLIAARARARRPAS